MLNPANFGLKENPFSIGLNGKIKCWAGLPDTRKALADVIASVRPDDVGASEFVVLSGAYGAGKSHALRYFTREINREGFGHAIYLNEIVTGAGLSFSALYAGILEQLQDDKQARLVDTVKNSIRNCMERMQKTDGHNVSADKAIENHVSRQDQALVKSLNNRGQIDVVSTTDDYSAVKSMASLFRVMTARIGDNPPPFGAVYLFLDEVENAVESRAPQQIAFFGALRSLVDEVTERFALVLSFNLPTTILEAAVPSALQERMTRPYIQCEQLTANGAKVFVKDYLEFVRPKNGFSPPQPFYPFSEQAIDTIFDRETALVPRRILMHLRRVWERAARYENLQPGDEISPEIADKILDGII